MEVLINDILKTYLLDYDIDMFNLKENYLINIPNSILDIASKITNKNGIYTHKSNFDNPTDNYTQYEASINEIVIQNEELDLKKISIKKYLTAYISSAIYLNNYLKNRFKEDFVVVFVFFISKEISHDLRYYKNRINEEWIPYDFTSSSVASGILMLK